MCIYVGLWDSNVAASQISLLAVKDNYFFQFQTLNTGTIRPLTSPVHLRDHGIGALFLFSNPLMFSWGR